MVTFRNNNNGNNRRGSFRRNTRNFKSNNENSKFGSNFSNNDNFYYSGVKNINESLEKNKKNVKFFVDENGLHNETSWASAMPEIFLNL